MNDLEKLRSTGKIPQSDQRNHQHTDDSKANIGNEELLNHKWLQMAFCMFSRKLT